MCVTLSDDIEHIPQFLSPIQSTNLRKWSEDSAPLLLFFLPMMPWCVVWCQPQKRRGCRQPETNTCTPLWICVCYRVNVFSIYVKMCEAENVFNCGREIYEKLEESLFRSYVCSIWVLVLIVQGVRDAEVHWEWAENAAWGLTLCSTRKQYH